MLETERLRQIRDQIGDRAWRDVALDELARASGLSRMTLYRRGITKDVIADGLAGLLATEYQEAAVPALVSPAPAPERLRLALEGFCRVNEAFLGLLDPLGSRVAAIFHEEGDENVLTRPLFTGALRRILQDGRGEGTLRLDADTDLDELATLLFNAGTWTYHHMRTGHRWSPDRAREQVVALLVAGMSAAPG